MLDEWRTVALSSVLKGGIRHGIYKPLETFGTGTRVLKMGIQFSEDRIGGQEMPRVPVTEAELKRYRVHEGDLLFSRTSMMSDGAGKCSLVVAHDEPFVFDGNILCGTPDAKIADSTFMYYFFKSPMGKQAIAQIIAGTQSRSLSGTNLGAVSVICPPLNEQRAIGNILGTLDHKIELNRRINESLEAIARTVFKSWFVDFDPVRARVEGGDSCLPQPIADRFPARLVDSELDEIPEGWKIGTLGDVLAELVSGARPKGGAVKEGVPSIGAENVIGLGRYDISKEKFVPNEFFEQLKRRGAAVRAGDVLLYKDGAQIGRKTYLDCDFPHAKCAVNEHVFILRAKRPELQRYMFFWLDQRWMTQEIISLNSNSAQPGINQSGVRNLPILIAPEMIVASFDKFAGLLTTRLFAGCIESQTLGAVRDALLPKLISGGLRVKDTEKFIARAV